MLYVSVVSFIALCFQYVNILFPDELQGSVTYAYDGIRWSSAALIVCFAVFLVLSHILSKEEKQSVQMREIRIRKWLLSFTLFVSAVTIIIDLIQLIYNFYSGEITTQFFLKVVVVLLVAGAVFGYYFWELKRSAVPTNLPTLCAWIAGAVVVVCIISGFFIAGSPSQQRQVRFDEQRVNDLSMIQSQVIYYWDQKGKLPTELADLDDDISGFITPVDPSTQLPYEYRAVEDLKFELCATFGTDQTEKNSTPVEYGGRVMPIGGDYPQNWTHGAGRVCFERTIDPELYDTDAAGVKKPVR